MARQGGARHGARVGAVRATQQVHRRQGLSGGKVFAVFGNWGIEGAVILKPTEMAREIWRGAEGVSIAPYLGRFGWIRIAPGAMSNDELADMIRASHGLIAAKLPRAARRGLGL